MAVTTNKGYELIVTGTRTDLWGGDLNTLVFTVVDSNLGGVTTRSLTNVNINLTAAESQTLRLALNGTLTGNVLVQTEAVGMTIIENSCTGNFTVTFRKNGVGTAIPIPNGTNCLVTTGASGNPNNIAVDFPTGTRLLFQQTTPPAGWVKDTTTSGLNNSAARITTGSVTSGGNVDFSSLFVNQTPTGSVGPTTLSIAQIPLHGHPWQRCNFAGAGSFQTSGGMITNVANPVSEAAYSGAPDATHQIGGEGGGGSHAHGLTMNPMNFQLKFFDVIVGVRV